MSTTDHIRALITRLARLDAAQDWSSDLNPAQRAALDYLSRANRFSRAPSHAAEYLGTTRGTASQTLKALARKGYIALDPSSENRRSISYDVTPKGEKAMSETATLETALNALPASDRSALAQNLAAALGQLLTQNDGRPFGLCQTCTHFAKRDSGGHCSLLDLALCQSETQKICHEHRAA